MNLKKFRIRKYRNIQDSGDVELLENLTCVVGKNQSGKTALLRGLYKFHPHNQSEVYDLSRDWPRGERSHKDKEQIVCEATFLLNESERSELAAMATDASVHTPEVLVTRNYAGQFEVHFPSHPDLFPEKLHPNVIDDLTEKMPKVPSPVGDFFGERASDGIEAVVLAVREGRYEELSKALPSIDQDLRSLLSPPTSQQQLQNENNFLAQFLQKANEMRNALTRLPTIHAKAHEYVIKKLPVFVYMDDYQEFEGTTSWPAPRCPSDHK